MRLSLGIAFAVLLPLQILQLVSANILQESKQDTNTSEDVFSGDYGNLNQTMEESGHFNLILPDSDNSSSELLAMSDHTSTSLVPKYNISQPVDPPSATSETNVNDTDTLQPKDTTTEPQPGTWNSNETVADTFEDTQNSTSTGDLENMTTAHIPPMPKTTNAPFEDKSNGTTPRVTTTTTTTNVITNKLPDPVTPEYTTVQSMKSNRTGGSFDARGGAERGVSSDIQQNTNSHAWGAILGIAAVVGITALAVYVIIKWKSYRDFSHRKLVEDTPGDPVLRLDNSEPLDLKFGGSAYYNPGLQGDNIQMTNFPQGRSN